MLIKLANNTLKFAVYSFLRGRGMIRSELTGGRRSDCMGAGLEEEQRTRTALFFFKVPHHL